MIAYGSNFGASKELAERFAERGDFHGYTSEVMTLDELARPRRAPGPGCSTVMTSTYTGNPPSNATAFKSWLEQTASGSPTWHNCRYLVWGLGNSQWNAFLAFPRYVHQKLSELGATPLADSGTATSARRPGNAVHADGTPGMARPPRVVRARADQGRRRALRRRGVAGRGGDSNTAIRRSLRDDGSRCSRSHGAQPSSSMRCLSGSGGAPGP